MQNHAHRFGRTVKKNFSLVHGFIGRLMKLGFEKCLVASSTYCYGLL